MAIKGLRPLRVARFLQQELGSILLLHTRNPLLKEVVVTHVKVSGDLHEATVFYRVLSGEKVKEVQEALETSSHFLERSLGPHLHMAVIPRLSFRFDTHLEEEERLENLFKKIEDEEDE